MIDLIYLACPYSGTAYQRHIRFIEVNKAAGMLIQQGYHVFSPISHTHPIKEVCGLDGDFKFWQNYDERMLALCDLVAVLTIPCWRSSVGVTAEIDFARKIGKPVKFLSKRTYELSEKPENL